MRISSGITAFMLTAAVILVQAQQPSSGAFGPLHKGPSKQVGEIHFATDNFDYSLYGDHCEIHEDKFLCLFTTAAHRGAAREWPAEKSWWENYAVDQFGEKHARVGSYYLSTRGNQQSAATVGAGDNAYLVQVFENSDKSATRLNIVSPHGEIRDMPVE